MIGILKIEAENLKLKNNRLIVRGEVFLTKKEFERINKEQEKIIIFGIPYEDRQNINLKPFLNTVLELEKEIKPITIATYNILIYRKDKNGPFIHFDLFNKICSNYNGYFDKETNKEIIHQKFIKYLDIFG
jgi:hypothetical protein